MILTCPSCSARHYDEGEFATKPHHTHACQSCGIVWRPAKIDTVGVRFLSGYQNAQPPAPQDDLVKLRQFAKDDGPSLAPYQDHSGFEQHDKLRTDIRAIIAELDAAPYRKRTKEHPMNEFMDKLYEDHHKTVKTVWPAFEVQFAALALAGEAGELANVVKKEWRDGRDLRERRLEETADVLVYTLLLAKMSGWTWDELLAMAHLKHARFMEKNNAN